MSSNQAIAAAQTASKDGNSRRESGVVPRNEPIPRPFPPLRDKESQFHPDDLTDQNGSNRPTLGASRGSQNMFISQETRDDPRSNQRHPNDKRHRHDRGYSGQKVQAEDDYYEPELPIDFRKDFKSAFKWFSGSQPSKPPGDRTKHRDDGNAKLSLQERYDILQAQLMSKDETMKRLESQMQMEQAMMKQSTNQMVGAMENKDLFLGPQKSDYELISELKRLYTKVRGWSKPFYHEHAFATDHLDEEDFKYFLQVAPNVGTMENLVMLLNDKSLRRHFVTGYVGLYLIKKIFINFREDGTLMSMRRDYWMGDHLSDHFSEMEDTFLRCHPKDISSREINDWRAFTATLISRAEAAGVCEDAPHFLNKQLEKRVGFLMNRIGVWIPTNFQPEAAKGLKAILLDAVRFSQLLRCQRASWTIRYPQSIVRLTRTSDRLSQPPDSQSNPFLADPNLVEDVDEDDDDMEEIEHVSTNDLKIVQIQIFPALFKRGNADGEHYERESCMFKSKMKCM